MHKKKKDAKVAITTTNHPIGVILAMDAQAQ